MKRLLVVSLQIGALLVGVVPVSAQTGDALGSWNDGDTKRAIIQFVTDVTAQGGTRFVPPAERVAVFDNDGTLWSEQPIYFQIAFALDRVKAMAPDHPEWKDEQPFKAILEGDIETVVAGGKHALAALMMASHANNTTQEFSQLVVDWLATAKHPKTGRRYNEMIYQPTLVRLPELSFIDDGAGKPVGINLHIGSRPILAYGNSDGDQQMLQWSFAGDGARFAGLVHHTDAAREWKYDSESSIGRLSKALVEAGEEGWTVVDMKRD